MIELDAAYRSIVRRALDEDIGTGDITTPTIGPGIMSEAQVVASGVCYR